MLESQNPESQNAFAPPSSSPDSPPPASANAALAQTTPRSLTVSLALWTFVCVVSAAPSFAWGMGTIAREQYLAMVLGIGVFIALYTWADQATQKKAWRRKPAIGLTLKIGYVTRLILSVIFPIGAGLDLFCGLFSVAIVEAVLPNLRSHAGGAADFEGAVGFWGAFLITMVQGATLNVVLLGYMTLVLAVVWAFSPHTPQETIGTA
jgi:hypothetical protein